jgi:hypothetical protein
MNLQCCAGSGCLFCCRGCLTSAGGVVPAQPAHVPPTLDCYEHDIPALLLLLCFQLEVLFKCSLHKLALAASVSVAYL